MHSSLHVFVRPREVSSDTLLLIYKSGKFYKFVKQQGCNNRSGNTLAALSERTRIQRRLEGFGGSTDAGAGAGARAGASAGWDACVYYAKIWYNEGSAGGPFSRDLRSLLAIESQCRE
ncbi:hypothetical protein V1478_008966 [Vespula squamosa]|uniref:Uncharacterized protein n=1 Tax=Vespula squamosa TaxID=30214 RepID=A0ABD2AV24_VESSQ